MRSLRLMLVAGLLAGAARADDRRPPEPAAHRPAPQPPPLSKEDAELVKQLALLERLELVKNLDLFQAEKDGGEEPQPQRQP